MHLLLDTCILYDWMMGAMADTEAVRSIRQAGA